MKRKNKEPLISFGFVRNLVVGILMIFFLCLAAQRVIVDIKTSERFKVREIVYDPDLQFMKSGKLMSLKGRNIFDVDLGALERQIQTQYPEISQLKLSKKFPDEIQVTARRRIPFAQTKLKNKDIVLDPEGIVLSLNGGAGKDLPAIVAADSDHSPINLGMPLRSQDIQAALQVIKAFRMNKSLANRRISTIDVNNLSQIEFQMADSFKIIVDQVSVQQKIQMLSFLLAQAKLNSEEVNYIDLRFKEPIIGKKPVKKSSEEARSSADEKDKDD